MRMTDSVCCPDSGQPGCMQGQVQHQAASAVLLVFATEVLLRNFCFRRETRAAQNSRRHRWRRGRGKWCPNELGAFQGYTTCQGEQQLHTGSWSSHNQAAHAVSVELGDVDAIDLHLRDALFRRAVQRRMRMQGDDYQNFVELNGREAGRGVRDYSLH